MLARQRAREREARALEAEEDAQLGMREMQAQQMVSRLARLDEQFRRIQELIGFVDMDGVVERIVAQQQAGQRMVQAKIDAVRAHP